MEGIQYHELLYTWGIIPWIHQQGQINSWIDYGNVWKDGRGSGLRILWILDLSWRRWKSAFLVEIRVKEKEKEDESKGFGQCLLQVIWVSLLVE